MSNNRQSGTEGSIITSMDDRLRGMKRQCRLQDQDTASGPANKLQKVEKERKVNAKHRVQENLVKIALSIPLKQKSQNTVSTKGAQGKKGRQSQRLASKKLTRGKLCGLQPRSTASKKTVNKRKVNAKNKEETLAKRALSIPHKQKSQNTVSTKDAQDKKGRQSQRLASKKLERGKLCGLQPRNTASKKPVTGRNETGAGTRRKRVKQNGTTSSIQKQCHNSTRDVGSSSKQPSKKTQKSNGNEIAVMKLMKGVEQGDVLSVSEILSSTAKKDQCPQSSYDEALIIACKCGHTRIVQLLIEKGANVNKIHTVYGTPLITAVENGFQNTARFLLLKGANVNISRNGNTSLMVAVSKGHSTEMVKTLLSHGAEVNTKNKEGKTPVLKCVENCDFETLKILIDHKADLDVQDSSGNTALSVALNLNIMELVQLLRDHSSGGLPNPPLVEAVERNSFSMTNILLNCSFVNVDEPGVDGNSSLNGALLKGYYDKFEEGSATDPAIIELLVKGGACVNLNTKGYLPLPLAAASGRAELVKLLLDAGADVNARDGFNTMTPLMYAAKRDKKEVLKLLIDAGANLECVSDIYDKHTALTFALSKGNTECAKLLLDKGAKIKPRDSNAAVINDQYESLRLLFKYKSCSQISNSVLFTAAEDGCLKTMELLIDNGMNVNAIQGNGDTLLMAANDYEVVQILLRKGADVNKCGAKGVSPLIHFCSFGNDDSPKIVDLLIKNSAEVNHTDACGNTALIRAVTFGREDNVKLLIDAGAEVNKTGGEGETALMAAAQKGYIGILELLLNKGANVNVQTTKDGNTALMYASMNGHLTAVQMLTGRNADVHLQDNKGNTALLVTTNESLANFLLESGASVNHQDKSGKSALMYAAKAVNLSLLKALIAYGADACLVSAEKETALSLVMNIRLLLSKHYECIEALLKAGAAKVCPLHCDVTLYRLIIENKRKLVQLCVTNGAPPSPICTRCLEEYHCFNKRGCRRLREYNDIFSPLDIALICGNIDMASYFTDNWYLGQSDLSSGKDGSDDFRSLLKDMMGRRKSIEFLEQLYSQPSSLNKLSFVATSDAMGRATGREERIKCSGLPNKLQEKLMFKQEVVTLQENPADVHMLRLNVIDMLPEHSDEFDDDDDSYFDEGSDSYFSSPNFPFDDDDDDDSEWL